MHFCAFTRSSLDIEIIIIPMTYMIYDRKALICFSDRKRCQLIVIVVIGTVTHFFIFHQSLFCCQLAILFARMNPRITVIFSRTHTNIYFIKLIKMFASMDEYLSNESCEECQKISHFNKQQQMISIDTEFEKLPSIFNQNTHIHSANSYMSAHSHAM